MANFYFSCTSPACYFLAPFLCVGILFFVAFSGVGLWVVVCVIVFAFSAVPFLIFWVFWGFQKMAFQPTEICHFGNLFEDSVSSMFGRPGFFCKSLFFSGAVGLFRLFWRGRFFWVRLFFGIRWLCRFSWGS